MQHDPHNAAYQQQPVTEWNNQSLSPSTGYIEILHIVAYLGVLKKQIHDHCRTWKIGHNDERWFAMLHNYMPEIRTLVIFMHLKVSF